MTSECGHRSVIVTGASRGIGRVIAQTLAARGCSLWLTARSMEGLMDTSRTCEEAGAAVVRTEVADQRRPDDLRGVVEHAYQTLGHVDVLVNNAGVSEPCPFLDETPESLTATWEANVLGPMLYAQAVGRRMVDAGKGRIINIASMNAHVGRKNLASYSASKGAILQLTRSLAVEWARAGIAVNAVCPGSTLTPMSESVLERESLYNAIVRTIPIGRMGEAVETARVVEFLALDAPDFVTGAAYNVDGGETAW